MATPTAALTLSTSNTWTNGAGTFPQPVPSAPTGLSAVAISSTQINLGLGSAPIAATQTEWSYKASASPTWLVLSTTATSTVALQVSGLTAATSYDFRVRYNGLNGYSAYSATVTTSTVVAPSVPVFASVVASTSTTVIVTLSSFPANATTVTLQRDVSASFTAPVSFTLSSPTVIYTDTGLTAGTTYYYRASATGAGGTSNFSSTSNATPGAADAYGISTYALRSLETGLTQGGAYFNDNTSGAATLQWLNDTTGNFARMTWPSGGGNAGPMWSVVNTTNPSIYMRWDYRRNTTAHSKRAKIFGRGYPSAYSNFNVHLDYSGVGLGIQYSDALTGGDISVGFLIGSYPTLTGGTAFSQSPHPVLQTQTATNEAIDNTWHTHEIYFKHSSDGNHDGEFAYWYDGVLIFWANSAFTCRTGGQGFALLSLGDYIQSNASAVHEDFRNWAASHDRPVGRGI